MSCKLAGTHGIGANDNIPVNLSHWAIHEIHEPPNQAYRNGSKKHSFILGPQYNKLYNQYLGIHDIIRAHLKIISDHMAMISAVHYFLHPKMAGICGCSMLFILQIPNPLGSRLINQPLPAANASDTQLRLRWRGNLGVFHRIHGAAIYIYGNMDPINIPPMLAYIPATLGFCFSCRVYLGISREFQGDFRWFRECFGVSSCDFGVGDIGDLDIFRYVYQRAALEQFLLEAFLNWLSPRKTNIIPMKPLSLTISSWFFPVNTWKIFENTWNCPIKY